MENYVSKLFRIMEEKGITAYQISKGTGIGQTTLSSWKTGTKPAMDKFVLVLQFIWPKRTRIHPQRKRNHIQIQEI